MSKAAVDAKLRAEGRCRLCRRPGRVRPLTRHRVVPGRYAGAYVANNCVPLCRPCHDLVDNRDRSTQASARRMLRASLWPVEVAHATRVRWYRGQIDRRWSFEDAYPKPARELVVERRALAV